MSKTTQSIWKSRLEEHIQDTRKYLKYMFNDHLVIVLIFFLAGGASWYSNWLKQIPAHFPSYWVMAVVFSLVLTKLLRADVDQRSRSCVFASFGREDGALFKTSF